MNDAPGWLINAIVKGIQDLAVLQLDRAPAADSIKTVTERWIFIIWQNNKGLEKTDKPRIERAFVKMSANIDKWPSPHTLMHYIPRKKQSDKEFKSMSKEEAARAYAKIRKELNL
jgi:hypothetical protein